MGPRRDLPWVQRVVQHLHHAGDQARLCSPLVLGRNLADAVGIHRLRLTLHHGQPGGAAGLERPRQLDRHHLRPRDLQVWWPLAQAPDEERVHSLSGARPRRLPLNVTCGAGAEPISSAHQRIRKAHRAIAATNHSALDVRAIDQHGLASASALVRVGAQQATEAPNRGQGPARPLPQAGCRLALALATAPALGAAAVCRP
mmetsp:Transcript_82222/g.236296  ORF Transcript_82222/g.236296 Transcript_82222/m.236296 type:complete len:201 (-) Transcript_82222:196-798(-)